MIPSTLLSLSPGTGTTAPAEMSDLTIYELAAAMGLVAGSLPGLPQWLVLRRHLPKAGIRGLLMHWPGCWEWW